MKNESENREAEIRERYSDILPGCYLNRKGFKTLMESTVRDDIAYLLAENERLRRENERLKDRVDTLEASVREMAELIPQPERSVRGDWLDALQGEGGGA